jgi:hypothetical protein
MEVVMDRMIGAFDEAHNIARLYDAARSGVFDVPVHAEFHDVCGGWQRCTFDTSDRTLTGFSNGCPDIERCLALRFNRTLPDDDGDDRRYVLSKDDVRTSMPRLFRLCDRTLPGPDFSHVLVQRSAERMTLFPSDKHNRIILKFVFFIKP